MQALRRFPPNPVWFGALYIMALSACSGDSSRTQKTTRDDLLGDWQAVRLWNNGSSTYPSFGNSWLFGEDGIVTRVGFGGPGKVSYDHFVLSPTMDSLHIESQRTLGLHAGIQLQGDTLVLTAFDAETGASKLYFTRMTFLPADTAFWHLHLVVDHYAYSEDGAQVNVVGELRNDSKHNFRDLEAELQLWGYPSDLKSLGSGQIALYPVKLPFVLGEASIPFEQTLDTPTFIKARDQKIYGWELVVHTKENSPGTP